MGGFSALYEPEEVRKALTLRLELESESAPHLEVVLKCFPQGVHCAPPGQGKAKGRKAGRSTLA
jgi:hypothetical protein